MYRSRDLSAPIRGQYPHLVAVPDPGHVGFAGALPCLLIAAPAIVHGAQGVTRALLTSIRVLNGEVPVALDSKVVNQPVFRSCDLSWCVDQS